MKLVKILAAFTLAVASFTVQATPPQQTPPVKGEVLEVKDVDLYTYLRIKTKDGETWAAVSKAPVTKGTQVSIENPMVMENFESKTLNKKFDKIVFGSLANPNAKSPAPMAPLHGETAVAGAPASKVEKATGPNAKTVAEVVAGGATLKDKTVLLRGQVVKVNLGIMGKNWLHLQDGSGSAAKGTNDILVTTKDKSVVGAIVTVKGTVRNDVNLGSGYSYAVLIDDAALQK